MTKRLALTPAVGLFAGLSVVSYGAVSMLLTGFYGTHQASTNPCTTSATASPTATATTKALIRPAARTGARAQHPAGMPVLLADVVNLSKSSSKSAPPLPSTSPGTSTPPLPQPSPGTSASPSPGGLPQADPAGHTSAAVTPGGSDKGPIKTPTPTPSTSPTSTSTPTPTPGTLCISAQTLNNVTAVDPGTTVTYAIFVWLTNYSGSGGSAKITLSASPSSVSPKFSVCVPSGNSSCTVGGLTNDQQTEVQAQLAAPARPATDFKLTATATSAQASNSTKVSVKVGIKAKNPSPTSSPAPNAGDGGTLPPGTGLPSGTTIPGLGTQPTGGLGSAFPQVSPSASGAGAGAAGRHEHSTRTIDLSAGLPLDVRLIGGQVIGLAVLAAAVTIAVARLSLRRQAPRHSEDSSGS
jgi:hypothetical protein